MGIDDEIKNGRDIFAELAKARIEPMTLKIENQSKPIPSRTRNDSFLDEPEGQLTVDVFQDENNIYVQSAVAGLSPEDLEINIAKESVTIRGKRERAYKITEKNFFYQECFWGRFSRSIVLPQEIDAEKSSASLKNGILTIKMPRLEKRKTSNIRVKEEE